MFTLDEANITPNMRVFVRCDLDVPIDSAGNIGESYRLETCLPTLKFILEKGAKLIIAGHIGRPKSTEVLLSTTKLKAFFDHHLQTTDYTLLENLRFDPREEQNDREFAMELAHMADMYVNESFGTSHREHTSIVGIPNYLPAFAGFRLVDEINVLTKLISNPEKPFVVIIGGSKIETKKPVISKFVNIANYILVGGKIGQEWDGELPTNVYLPIDYATASKKDIGPKTIQKFTEIISQTKTILWAGPLGMFEEDESFVGTKTLAQAAYAANAYTVIGGGDTIAAFDKAGVLHTSSSANSGIDFVSTGGGAMLEFLANGNLPGLKALGYSELQASSL